MLLWKVGNNSIILPWTCISYYFLNDFYDATYFSQLTLLHVSIYFSSSTFLSSRYSFTKSFSLYCFTTARDTLDLIGEFLHRICGCWLVLMIVRHCLSNYACVFDLIGLVLACYQILVMSRIVGFLIIFGVFAYANLGSWCGEFFQDLFVSFQDLSGHLGFDMDFSILR